MFILFKNYQAHFQCSTKFTRKIAKVFLQKKKTLLHLQSQNEGKTQKKTSSGPSTKGELSSAGSEHLPYKQRVGGSNPQLPQTKATRSGGFFVIEPLPAIRLLKKLRLHRHGLTLQHDYDSLLHYSCNTTCRVTRDLFGNRITDTEEHCMADSRQLDRQGIV